MKKSIYLITTLLVFSCNTNNREKENRIVPQREENKQQFIWNFSKGTEFSFSYSHTATVTTKMNANEPADKLLITSDGVLNVIPKSNNIAELNLFLEKINMTKYDTRGIIEDKKSTDSVTYGIIEDYKTNGTFSNPKQLDLFYLLFPLPSTTLKIGDSVKSTTNFNSSNQLTFKGYEMFEGRKCAVLTGQLKMREQEIPDLLKDIYNNTNEGFASYFFDLKERHYVGAYIEWSTKSIRVKNPYKNDIDMYYGRIGNNVIKIRLDK